MELDDRKSTILKAIVSNYLETGEPVGSRTISKMSDLGLSSATIRNEMADLEELGYIVQPHTSAGRIPTDAGYRFYVDQLIEHYRMTNNEINQINRIFGQNQVGSEIVRPNMFGNKYPWEKAKDLFGKVPGYGAQMPK